MVNNQLFDAPWNPMDPIKELFDYLEKCYIFGLLTRSLFTIDQMIGKALITI